MQALIALILEFANIRVSYPSALRYSLRILSTKDRARLTFDVIVIGKKYFQREKQALYYVIIRS